MDCEVSDSEMHDPVAVAGWFSNKPFAVGHFRCGYCQVWVPGTVYEYEEKMEGCNNG